MHEPKPTERELEILKALWELGPATVRQVHQRLCPDGELAQNTIQTLMRIMDDKGLVEHQRQGRSFVYTPCHGRERIAGRFLDKVFDGAIDQLVSCLLQSRKASPAELRRLQRIIAASSKEK